MSQLILSVALCDDDALFLNTLEKQVRKLLGEQDKACEVFCYQSAEALMQDLHGGKRFSLLMLDIMMSGLNGMDLARALRGEGRQVPIIFISSNCDYALSGYEIDALRFLAKPVDENKLREALAAAEAKERLRVLPIKNTEGLHRVDVDGIVFLEVWERGVLLHLSDGSTIFSTTKIGTLEVILPECDFVRCHQGYIVNLAYVRTLKATDVYMTDGSRVPVSRYRLTDLRERFTGYLNQ